jgi:hypothetical protein
MLMALSRGADGLRLRRQRALSAEVAVAGSRVGVSWVAQLCLRAGETAILRLLLRSGRKDRTA